MEGGAGGGYGAQEVEACGEVADVEGGLVGTDAVVAQHGAALHVEQLYSLEVLAVGGHVEQRGGGVGIEGYLQGGLLRDGGGVGTDSC